MEIDVCAKGGDVANLESCIQVDLNMIVKESYNAMVRHSSEAGPSMFGYLKLKMKNGGQCASYLHYGAFNMTFLH